MISAICFRKAVRGLFAGAILAAYSQGAAAALIHLEPDNFPPATVLNTVEPGVTLGVYNTILGALESPLISDIQSVADTNTSTGTRVFGINGLASFGSTRQLNMTFAALTDVLSIDFIGSSAIAPMIGKLDIFNSVGTLLGTYTTAGLGLDVVETMSFTRMTPDVKFARAYTSSGSLPFGRLDNLSFEKYSVVPEPTALCLLSVAVAIACVVRRPSR